MQDKEFNKENYLTDVIFKIEFPKILKLSGSEINAISEFQEKISDKFPNVEVMQDNEFKLNFNPYAKESDNLVKNHDLMWVFDDGFGKRIELDSTTLSLSYKLNCYKNFNEFLEDTRFLIKSLDVYNTINEIKFMGLRYINQYDDENIVNNLDSYFDSKLTKFIEDTNENYKINQSLTRSDFRINNINLIFQYGLFNPFFPDVEGYKNFILDFDCFTTELINLDNIEDFLNNLHDCIKYEFNKCFI